MVPFCSYNCSKFCAANSRLTKYFNSFEGLSCHAFTFVEFQMPPCHMTITEGREQNCTASRFFVKSNYSRFRHFPATSEKVILLTRCIFDLSCFLSSRYVTSLSRTKNGYSLSNPKQTVYREIKSLIPFNNQLKNVLIKENSADCAKFDDIYW